MNRAQRISVLLLIVFSHSLVAAHTATHAQAELSECELCAANADPSDTISAAEVSALPVATALRSFQFPDPAPSRLAIFGVHPRGPPLAI